MVATPRLALGTAQFGLPYGAGDSPRQMERGEVRDVLAAAWDAGIDLLDTAAAYGEAERLIGELKAAGARFKVVSKIARLGLAEIGATDIAKVRDGVRASVRLLRVDALEGLLVHHAPDLLSAGGASLFRALEELRAEGVVRRLGVSVYDSATLNAVLDRFPVQIVQLPVSLLDQRLVRDGTLAQLASRNVEVHARSVFLQGVLLADAAQLPPRFDAVRGRIERLNTYCAGSGISRAAAALRFVAGCAGVGRIIIGVDGAAQLKENLLAFSAARDGSRDLDASVYALDDAEIIDPRKWAA